MQVSAQIDQFRVPIYVRSSIFLTAQGHQRGCECVSVNVNLSCTHEGNRAVCIVLSLTCFCTTSAEVTEAVLTLHC